MLISLYGIDFVDRDIQFEIRAGVGLGGRIPHQLESSVSGASGLHDESWVEIASADVAYPRETIPTVDDVTISSIVRGCPRGQDIAENQGAIGFVLEVYDRIDHLRVSLCGGSERCDRGRKIRRFGTVRPAGA